MCEEQDATLSSTSTTSADKKESLFTLPPLSDIKQANKVADVATRPTLFKQGGNSSRQRDQVSSQGESASSCSSEVTTHPPSKGVGSIKDVTGSSHESKSISGVRRKRAREQVDFTAEIPPKVARFVTNERVIPRQAGNYHKLVSTAMTDDSASSSSGVQSSTGAVPASEGIASSSSSTAVPTAHHPHAIIANLVQKKNPVMKHIRNVPWELGDIVPDFVLGKTTCAMFLSIRYHSLHPNYIHSRLKELGRQYQLRILLVLVDMKECQRALQELAKIAVLADLTLMLAWSYEEAGRYLETYKAFENKPPDMLMERIDSDFSSRAVESLTTVKKVNKTDAATLLNNFKTMDRVISASREELVLCPGLGPQKAQRLFTLFHQPFKTTTADHPK